MATLHSSSLPVIHSILRLDPSQRKPTDLAILLQHFLSLDPVRDLHEEVRPNCVSEFRLREFAYGEVIYSAGQPADDYYVLLTGLVRSSMTFTKAKSIRRDTLFQGKVLETLLPKGRDRHPVKAFPHSIPPPEPHSELLDRSLTPGEAFGEESLLPTSQRITTVSVLQPCAVAYLSGEVYSRLVREREEKRVREQTRVIREMPAFAKWTRKSLSQLVGLMREKTVYKGQVLYKEGDAPEYVYFSLSGEFQLSKQVEIDKEAIKDFTGDAFSPQRRQQNRFFKGNSVAVLTKTDRQIFGYMEVMEDCNRDFTCVCMSRTGFVLELCKTDFMRRTQTQDTWSVLQRMGQEEKAWAERQMLKLNCAELEKRRIALSKPKPMVLIRRSSASPAHRKTGSMTDMTLGETATDLDFRHASVKRTASFTDQDSPLSALKPTQRTIQTGHSPGHRPPRSLLPSRQFRRLSSLL